MTARRLALLLALFVFGCASGGGGGDEGASKTPSLLGSGAKIGVIAIDLDPGITADQREVIAQYEAVDRLETQLKQALQTRSAYSPEGEMLLGVTLDGFRLRSNNANIWLGSMAGADSLSVQVAVQQQDQVLKTFETDTSSIQGGLMMPGRTQRLDRLVAELAKRIAAGI